MKQSFPGWSRYLLLILTAWLLSGAVFEFYNIGWGTGIWLGQFAPSWFAAFMVFALFSIVILVAVTGILWQPQRFENAFVLLVTLRSELGVLRWLLAVLLLFFPVYLLQYTFWGIVLHGPYLRIFLVTWISIVVAWLFSSSGFIQWSALAVSILLVAASFALFEPFVEVTSYPFSLGWSEGNRLWDYSVLYGRGRYDYPANQVIPVFLDIGRQFVGGIPFLISGLTIWQARFWLALVDVIPYLLLGWIAFRPLNTRFLPWILAGVWGFLFVRQGPIHPPLLLCAIVIALAWKRPLWLAVPLVFAAGYFAQLSRFTWLFAPAMWAIMLEFASVRELNWNAWKRSLAVGIAGVLGGYFAPKYLPAIVAWFRTLGQLQAGGPGEVITGGGGVSIPTVQAGLSSQPLLWSRLLPNETYGPGILFGLILAVIPSIVVLVYFVKSGKWQMQPLQKVSIVLPLLAFFIVGLIVSVKIGGGGDLHNMDMFIIGLLFAAAMAWANGGYEWISATNSMPVWLRITMVALFALPAFKPLTQMRPLSVHRDIKFVAILADITPMDPLPNPLPDTIPSDEDTELALEKVRKAVTSSLASGEILFMDQRQLLTFGYLDVPLVPEYDKKLLIDEAMADNALYFETFYNDLAAHRFSLIITSPVNRRLDQEEGHFDDENNAWVKWVTKPLLCYYEPLDILKKVDVELLVPRAGVLDCESELP